MIKIIAVLFFSLMAYSCVTPWHSDVDKRKWAEAFGDDDATKAADAKKAEEKQKEVSGAQ